MPVSKRVKSEAETVAVDLSRGEFLQYVVSSPLTDAKRLRFSLTDAFTKEVVLSEKVPRTIEDPSTFTRLWPVVGDRPQSESSLVLAMNFAEPNQRYTLRVMRRRANNSWIAEIDVDFESSIGGDWYMYAFRVKAE